MFCTNKLEEYVDLRYEQQAAQKELEDLETLYAHFVTEDEPNMTEDDPNEREAIGPGAELEEWLAHVWAQHLLPEKERDGYYTDEELLGNLKEALWELSGRKPREDVTVKQIWDAAKDIYEWKLSLIQRYKSKEKINHIPSFLVRCF